MAEGFGAFRRNSKLSEIPKRGSNPDFDARKDEIRRRKGEATTPLRRPRRGLKTIESEDESFLAPELKNNKPAFEYLREKYDTIMAPLIGSLQSNPRAQLVYQKVVQDRANFRVRIKSLKQQRTLSTVERDYLDSVQLLSVFNPRLVFAAKADPGLTAEYARHHLNTISSKTLNNLGEGDYVPLLQIGLGPHGIIALSEVVRNRPDLAKTMLVVDAGNEPGGPFAVPGGAAWALNSANVQGSKGRILPDSGNNRFPDEEERRVRSYGSPLRHFPGERKAGSDVRQGSINMLSDYLPLPDDISLTRYATNEELQTISLMQSAMLANRLALRTKVVRVEPNPDKESGGNKVVTLEIGGDTPRRIRITTDAVFAATGLGEPTYGFNLEGKQAKEVLAKTAGLKGFPKLSTPLQAFKALVSRTEEPASPGEVLAIYGNGDSTRTLVENLASLFKSDNPNLRELKKIYVIASEEPSLRPRYGQTLDVRSSDGRRNLVEFIQSRVGDIEFERKNIPVGKRKLIVLGRGGRPLQDNAGNDVRADSCIAATGFRPGLGKVFGAYEEDLRPIPEDERDQDRVPFEDRTEGDLFFSTSSPTTFLTLPQNDVVAVAETLRDDPDVVLLGTASLPGFDEDKLSQLPESSASALEKVGTENAVAIGFRGPDTQAAVNIWLNSRTLSFSPRPSEIPKAVVLEGEESVGASSRMPISIDEKELKIPNNIRDESEFLTPLLSYGLEGVRIEQQNGKSFGGVLAFSVTQMGDSFDVTFEGTTMLVGGEQPAISEALLSAVADVWKDKDVQRYALSLLSRKRLAKRIRFVTAFKSGKISPRDTFVEG